LERLKGLDFSVVVVVAGKVGPSEMVMVLLMSCLIWMDAKVLLEQLIGKKTLVYSFTKKKILWISVFAYMHGVFPNKWLTFRTHASLVRRRILPKTTRQ
jgi:hypothetical protein